MNPLLNSALTLTYSQLSAFSGLDSFWQSFDTAFGTQYNRSIAEILRLQWQTGDFSQIPQIEILDSSILGTANGAYASSTNQIYLSANFVATATPAAISALLLEEIGHFVDAQINLTDSAGDEGAIFAELVQGYSLDDATLQALQAEDDSATITVNGQTIQVEQQDFTGTSGNDTIEGTSSDDKLFGQGGNDTLLGQGGNDQLFGGTGSDTLTGGTGSDQFVFETFNNSTLSQDLDVVTDFVKGQDKIDLSTVGIADYQTLLTLISDDSLGDAVITARFNNSSNPIYGYRLKINGFSSSQLAATDYILSTSVVNDTITGSNNTDDLFGGLGNDTLQGSGGEDRLFGEQGDDRFLGGTGSDTFIGGTGLDTFVFETFNNSTLSQDLDVVTDFVQGQDKIDLRSVGIADYQTLLTLISDDSLGDAVITARFNNSSNPIYGYRLKINGFSSSQLAATDYILSTSVVNDTITGSNNTDDLFGGLGNDTLQGSGGNDRLFGEQGDDRLLGGTGNDTLYGGEGTDTAVYSGTFSQYQITTNAGVTTITDSVSNRDGIDTLSGVEKVQFSDQTITLTNNVLPTITLAVSPASVTEDGTANLIYTFTRTGSTTNTLTVNFSASSNGVIGTDFTESGTTTFTDNLNGTATGTVTFLAGSSTATVTVDPTADTLFESDITISVNVTSGTGYIAITTPVSATITDDDVAVIPVITLAVSPPSVTEDGTANLIYTFTRTGSTTNALSVNYGINGTANGSDYTGATPGTGKTITFAAGSSTAILTINPTADTTVEANETVALTLASGTGYTVGTTTAVTGTITNDDVAVIPVITLAVSPPSVTEDGTANLIYTFTRTGSTTNALSVNYGINGTANGSDYTGATPGTGKTITFAAGSSTAILTINPTADTTVEANETVALTLASGTGYTVGTTTAVTGTITNDDLPPLPVITIAATDANAAEPTNPGVFTLTRTGSTTSALTVNYTTAGTATNGTDYSNLTGTVTFAAGSNTATVTVNPIDDTIVEGTETAILNLAAGTGYTLGTVKSATVNIADNDLPPLPVITIAATDANAAEPTNPGVFTLTRTGSTTSALTVNYTTAGTATNGTDYSNLTGTVTFAAGSATATVTVNPIDDTIVEGTETAILNLAAGTGYTLGTAKTATVNIADNDLPPLPVITIAATDANAAEPTNPGVFTLTRTGSTTSALTVNYTTAGTATNGTDYSNLTGTVTFAAGSATATVTVNPIDDTIVEGTETAILNLATGTGYTLGAAKSATVNIADNDLPLITINLSDDQTIVEGSTSSQNVSYTVTLSDTSTQTITVQYATSNGTAIAGSDYTGKTGTLTFNPGVTSQVINIPIVNNFINEADETFTLSLTSPTNASLGTKTSATTTITDTLTASVTTTLPPFVENLSLTGTASIDGTGNAGNNVLIGNHKNNILFGGSGADTLKGKAGDDTLIGGADADIFEFGGQAVAVNPVTGLSEETGTTLGLIGPKSISIGKDTITDFATGVDQILLDISTFTAVGPAGSDLSSVANGFSLVNQVTNDGIDSENAYLVYNQGTGDLFYNVNLSAFGSGGGGIFANLGVGTVLAATDISLIA
ncbi:Calx-beta domain-containing protein [Anabaena sp. PCC 7108]|uniref:beta strand repeat-containing protein n=1 Tax=Anabaena sp. PCC 7108 TaxID=163908 RepID=UPI000347BBD4|nr:Calx-beta domain-containing protein [Anabaena sp. PCC 7108]